MDVLERGSIWRRWDLHVHTPETIFNDQFGGWDEYLVAIEAHPDVKVIGATDYFGIANYSKLAQFKREGRLQNIDLLIPNLEFRIAPETDHRTPINIHLLVSPDDPDHETKIADALVHLEFEYNRVRYSCAPAHLAALGKAIDSTITDDRAARREGAQNFKVDFHGFKKWFEGQNWLRENALVLVDGGQTGLSGFLVDGQFKALRHELTRFCQVVLSGRPKERDFWLSKTNDADRETVRKLGGLRPCVHGSDAHEIAKLFKPDKDRFCWIKADTTFEGLRQILYEPEDRVFIGPTPPNLHDITRVIREVRIFDSSGAFNDVVIPLNRGLVSLIGQKGSGKSALAELIAYAAGSWKPDNGNTFLERANDALDGLQVELEWEDGATTRQTVAPRYDESGLVRYLSQDFVERLCAKDGFGSDLVREIESVIFSYLEPTEKLNASSFEELRSLRTQSVVKESRRLRHDIQRLIAEEDVLYQASMRVAEKRERIAVLVREFEGLTSQLPKAESAEEQATATALAAARNELVALQQVIATSKQKIQKAHDAAGQVQAFKGQIDRFRTTIDALLGEVGVPENERRAFYPAFPGDTDSPIQTRVEALEHVVADKMGADDGSAPGTVKHLQKQINELLEKESADKAQRDRVRAIHERIAQIDSEIASIKSEIEKIEGPDMERRNAISAELSQTYAQYFSNMKNEREMLEKMYGPVAKRLSDVGAAAQEQLLEFSIRYDVEISRWLERGSPLFDQRKTIPFGTMEALGEKARKVLGPAWASGVAERIVKAREDFLSEFNSDAHPPARYLRSGVTRKDLLEWLHEVDHIQLSYGLRYNGTDLRNLSPGTKGIVLLILYLGIDIDDSRPLIVDQPDENLDNESIFELLTGYFRRSKLRRQVIVITHNPNLVVNSDAEQVIVATAERKKDGLPAFRYEAGALEHNPEQQGIRSKVCRILEGGAAAFQKREQRYALPRDID